MLEISVFVAAADGFGRLGAEAGLVAEVVEAA